MNKGGKIALAVIIPAVLGLVFYKVSQAKNKTLTPPGGTGGGTSGGGGGGMEPSPKNQPSQSQPPAHINGVSTDTHASFPLQEGSQGIEVRQLQKKLNSDYNKLNNIQPLVVDGIFGPLTKAAYVATGFKYPVDQSTYLNYFAA